MGMANSPHPDTVTVSFTLPRDLAAAVDRRARQNLTNKSDIIRRALLAFIPKEEADAIMASVLNDSPMENPPPSKGPVSYRAKGGGR